MTICPVSRGNLIQPSCSGWQDRGRVGQKQNWELQGIPGKAAKTLIIIICIYVVGPWRNLLPLPPPPPPGQCSYEGTAQEAAMTHQPCIPSFFISAQRSGGRLHLDGLPGWNVPEGGNACGQLALCFLPLQSPQGHPSSFLRFSGVCGFPLSYRRKEYYLENGEQSKKGFWPKGNSSKGS